MAAHLNTNYRHFLLFVDEVGSLAPFIAKLTSVSPALGERPCSPRGLQQDHPGGDVLEVTRCAPSSASRSVARM